MNAESITTWLETVGVPAEVVSVGTEADNAWCLLREEPLGEEGAVTWEVFWREQGNRYDWARFSNEQVACHYLFGRLTWAQVARGAVGVLPAPGEPPAPAQPEPAQPAPVAQQPEPAAPPAPEPQAPAPQS